MLDAVTKRGRGRPKNPPGRKEPVKVLVLIPQEHLAGIDAKRDADGIARTHAILDAIALHGTFPKGERPALFGKPPGLVMNVDAGGHVHPIGSRLDKSSIGKRLTAKEKPRKGSKPSRGHTGPAEVEEAV